ncbi:unnamed protein product [Leptosia nina]|uniref:Uncharacterized protein n=1 Tax=Leptosia nina TaxID=320188 RepID=A0AAV1JN05_9NEOP
MLSELDTTNLSIINIDKVQHYVAPPVLVIKGDPSKRPLGFRVFDACAVASGVVAGQGSRNSLINISSESRVRQRIGAVSVSVRVRESEMGTHP